MESDFEKKLHRVKPKGLTPDEKSMLWANIENSVQAEDYIKAHKKVGGPFNIFASVKRARYVVAAILTGTLIAGSFGTVALADNSRPGDFLFPVELASENIRLRLTSPDNRDELRIQFASERLEEVKELLALANISYEELAFAAIVDDATTTEETATSSDETATTTDDGSEDDTTTEGTTDTTDDTDTSDDTTQNNNEDEDSSDDDESADDNDDVEGENDDNESTDTQTESTTSPTPTYDRDALARASNAFLIALNYLEDSRDSLISDGNDTAVIAIDAFIEELTILADGHVDDIERARIVVNDNGPNDTDRVNISIKASIDDVKTEFNFVEVKEEDGDLKRQKVSLDNGDSALSLKVNQNRTVVDIDNTKSDKDEKPHIHVCYKNKNIDVHYSDISSYLKKGAKFGDCEGHDDDDKDEKRYYICYKGNTKHVSYDDKGHYLSKGAKLGKCNDHDHDDNDDIKVPSCPLDDDVDGRWIVDFKGQSLRSDKGANSSYTSHYDVRIDAGTYKVTLVSYDGYKGRENKSQPNESYEVVFWDKSDYDFQRTSAISDVPDNVRQETVIEVVDEAFEYDGEADDVYAQHSEYPDKSNANSVRAICAAFDKVSDDGRDTDAPQINNIEVSTGETWATVGWDTDENATSKVWFSDESDIEVGGDTDFVSSGSLKKDHLLTINGLTPDKKYYFIVESEDASENVARSSKEDFETKEETDETAPIITGIAVNPTTTEATVAWITDEDTTGVVWYSESSPVDPDGVSDGKLSDTLKTSHSVDIDSLNPDTTYYYIVVATDGEGNTATSTEDSFDTTPLPEPEDVVAPQVSNIDVDATTTEATISFDTDEDAKTVLWYGMTSGALDLSDDDTTLQSSHVYNLTGLTTETMYYYEIVATDESGNTATTSESSFETDAEPVPADETAPVVSGVNVTTSSTTADVSFDTDEDATSKVYYSTVSPVDLGSADVVTNDTLGTNHVFALPSLTASTTYYYVITAKDASDNEVTETEDSFTTL